MKKYFKVFVGWVGVLAVETMCVYFVMILSSLTLSFMDCFLFCIVINFVVDGAVWYEGLKADLNIQRKGVWENVKR